VVAAQDRVNLLKSRFDVRRAELDVQKNELVSTIDARKNDLALEQAKRVLAELEQDVKSRSASGQAAISLAEEKHNKAKLAMDQAQGNINRMRVTAPMDGLVALEKNEEATGGFFSGGPLPEYHEGDQVEAGRTVGQVIDPTEMEMNAKVGELERSNIKEGQPVDIELDALPGSTFQGKVKNVGGASNRMPWDDDATARFEISIKLSTTDSRMRPGMTAHIFVHGDLRKDVLYVPRQALFLKENKRLVFVRNGNSFDPREVKIQAENESRAAVEGIGAGIEIALIDPTASRKTTNANVAPPGGGGAP
jgi:HlyD family secretion protein